MICQLYGIIILNGAFSLEHLLSYEYYVCIIVHTHYVLICNQVALGIAYRVYDSVMAAMKKDTKICWTVNRGEGLSPVQSCEGKGSQ